MLRHHSLSSFSPLRVLYIGIFPAVSPVRLECVFAKVAVRINEDSLVHFIGRNCSMPDAFCYKSASNEFREDRMKTADDGWTRTNQQFRIISLRYVAHEKKYKYMEKELDENRG